MAATPTTTRRERHRQQTYDEIVDVARRLLQTPDALSLRAIATEMGITAPGLYRYVDSYQELLVLLARSIFTDVIASMAQARDRYPRDDPAAQIVASAAAFRRWAMGHHQEFRLLFATPSTEWPQSSEPPVREPLTSLSNCTPDNGSDEFSAYFSELFTRLLGRYDVPIPADDELDPRVVAALKGDATPTTQLPGEPGSVPAGLVWIFERAWARLYGTITLEVFGHVHPEFIASGALFRATMQDIGADLGLGPDWDRLTELLHDESAITA